jgi:hypothetical protein
MRVKITGASGLVWYKDQIGNTFTCYDRSESYYGLGAKGMTGLTIQKWDCEILPEETPQPEPFDLDRALKGEVIVKDNSSMYVIGKSKNGNGKEYICETVKDGANFRLHFFHEDYLKTWFMAPKEPQVVTRWVNVYEGYGHFNTGTTTYESKESAAAKKNNANTNKYIGSFPVQITLNN